VIFSSKNHRQKLDLLTPLFIQKTPPFGKGRRGNLARGKKVEKGGGEIFGIFSL
jgi:hypothetical protein